MSTRTIQLSEVPAEWERAIAAELPKHSGNRIKAIQAVAKARPKLRAAFIAQANAQQDAKVQAKCRGYGLGFQVQARAVVTVQARSNDDFRQEVERMVADGFSRDQAIRQLSKSMGLSQPSKTDRWDSLKSAKHGSYRG